MLYYFTSSGRLRSISCCSRSLLHGLIALNYLTERTLVWIVVWIIKATFHNRFAATRSNHPIRCLFLLRSLIIPRILLINYIGSGFNRSASPEWIQFYAITFKYLSWLLLLLLTSESSTTKSCVFESCCYFITCTLGIRSF